MASRTPIETIASADPPCHGGTIRAASAFEVPRRTGAERPGGPGPDRVQPPSPNTQGSLSTTRNLERYFPPINDEESRQRASASLFERLRRLATNNAYQRVPRAGRMPRSSIALAIASSVVAPVLRTASMTGSRPHANWSAATIWIPRPHTPAAAMLRGLP